MFKENTYVEVGRLQQSTSKWVLTAAVAAKGFEATNRI